MRIKIKDTDKKLTETTNSLNQHQESLEQLNSLLSSMKIELEQEVESIIQQMKESIKNDCDYELEVYKEELEKFERDGSNHFVKLNLAIQKCEFIENQGVLEKKIEEIKETLNMIEQYTISLTTPEIINSCSELGYGAELSNDDLEKFTSWLDYFNQYDKYDEIMGVIQKREVKMWKKVDSSFVLLGVIGFFVLVYKYPALTLLPYLVFTLSTLFIRTKQFYKILVLIGLFGFLNGQVSKLKERNNEEVKRLALHFETIVSKLYNKFQQDVSNIKDGLEDLRLKNLENRLALFDENKAREEAEETVQDNTESLEKRVSEEEKVIEKLNEKVEELKEMYDESISELENLKQRIKETYEYLKPDFSSSEMLETFFLGFKDDEPVFFKYSGEPCAIFYSGKAGEKKATLSFIKMMCCQVMTTMNPLAYNITILDLLTGGADLAPFQVNSQNEEKLTKSKIFTTIGTQEDTKNYLEELYEEYQTRRVKVLGSYNNIREYNEYKRSVMARTLAYKIAYFFEYNYKLLISDDKLQQLCRISKSIGFCFIFMVDIDKFKPEDKDKNGDKQKNLTIDDVYEYSFEDLLNILKLFENENIYSFKYTGDDVDIIPTTNSEIQARVNGGK